MIKASDVKELRDLTNVGMMECKKALTEAGGDKEEAIKLLKEKGLSISAKRSGKETNEGSVYIEKEGSKVWMLSICCETDFVAKNDDFNDFVKQVGGRFKTEGLSMLEAEDFKSLISETVAKTGEKIDIVDPVVIESNGYLETYLHANRKVGVIVELKSDNAGDMEKNEIKELAKDLCLQIAAMDPVAITMDDVSEEVKNEQKEIFLKQMEEDPKPANIKEKIIVGKINKFFSEKCLLEMDYVKDSGSVKEHIESVNKAAGTSVKVNSFKRSQIGN